MINPSRIQAPTELKLKPKANSVEFSQNLSNVMDKGVVTKSEFNSLAKSVQGGKKSLSEFLLNNNIVPQKDALKLAAFYNAIPDQNVTAKIQKSAVIQSFIKTADGIPLPPPLPTESIKITAPVKLVRKDKDQTEFKAKMDVKATELTARKTEILEELKKPDLSSDDKFFLKKELSGIEDQLGKIDTFKKMGITKSSVEDFQVKKSGSNLYQRVLSTTEYSDGKKTSLLNKDKLGALPSFKPAIKGSGDWGSVKKDYMGGKTFDGKDISMRQMTLYRKAYVDQLVTDLKQKYNVDLKMVSFGSTNLTSDYDATISVTNKSGGKIDPKLEVKILKEFNDKYREEWGVESGTMFDTNLYVQDFDLSSLQNVERSPEAQAIHDKSQDALALVKQRMYMPQEKWDAYVETVVAGVPDSKKESVRAQYNQANTYAVDRQSELNKMIVKLNLPDLNIDGLDDNAISRHVDSIKAAAGDKVADIEPHASNQLYAEKLLIVKNKIIEGESLSGDDLQLNLAEVEKLKGQALFFASEPYFSEGAVRHIVGNLQKLKDETFDNKYEISKPQALESLSENLGDTLKDFSHYEEKGLGTVAFKTSKYVNRLADAITATLGTVTGEGAAKKFELPEDMNITLGGKVYPLKKIMYLFAEFV